MHGIVSCFHVAIHLTPWLQAMKSHYDHFADFDISLNIGFQRSKITLDIPEGPQKGWKIVPMSYPSVSYLTANAAP